MEGGITMTVEEIEIIVTAKKVEEALKEFEKNVTCNKRKNETGSRSFFKSRHKDND